MNRFETVEIVPFQPGQMQALVADVATYPRFMPFVKAARVWNRREGEGGARQFMGELVVGFQAFRGTFATTVEVGMDPPTVATRLVRGPFKALECRWRFDPAVDGCLISVVLDFEFSEPFLASLLRSSMDAVVARLVRAFTEEAERRYRSGDPPAPGA
jgi:coenzyme Q-binding protein COQ10